MKQAQKSYEELYALSRHAKVIEGTSTLIAWDQETYMPPASSAIRGEQLEVLSGLIHAEKTGPAFTKALKKLIDLKSGKVVVQGLSVPQKAALREWRRDYQRASALPTRFVEEFAQLTSQSIEAWKSAKQERSFMRFAPFLDRIIAKNREKAELVGYQDHPYDALLDEYEPGTSTKEVAKLFGNLGKAVSALTREIAAAKKVDDRFLFGKFDADKQMAFCRLLLEQMGFDFSKGRLDLSAHPFSTSSHPTDSRLTVRIHPTSLMSSISAALHEGGHSLYEMGMPQEAYGSPLCEPISFGIHESQSRWWETRIGLSKPFWKHYLPLLKQTFKGKLAGVSLEQFYPAINKVEPSLIRVEADEVTYSLHVILRFELEKALIEGSLKVRDIPDAWNEKVRHYLGIYPKHDSEGCLQDIHWAMGAFGYFPSYTLGNLYAAQLFESFEKQNLKWKAQVEKGKLLFIKEWLNESVHQYGRQFSSKELIKQVTGKQFSEQPYLNYLTGKYGEIYFS
jgi:carboxypeptidase Taq